MPCCSLTFARNFNWTPICGKVRFRAFQFVIILWIDFPWIFLPFFDFAKCNFVLCVSYLWLLKNCILWDHTLKEHNDQCDQIGRNFATLAKKWKSLANVWIFISYLANVEPTLANLLHYWANFHCCSWPNIEIQSNHLVTLTMIHRVGNLPSKIIS